MNTTPAKAGARLYSERSETVLPPALPRIAVGSAAHACRVMLLALMTGCASLSAAQDRAARLPEVQQVLLEARRVAGTIREQDKEIKNLALVAIAARQLAAGDASGALGTMVAKPDPLFPRPTALAMLAMWQHMASDQTGYERSVGQAVESVAALESAPERVSALIEIAEVQVRAGDGPGARKTVAGIDDARHRGHAITRIEKALAQPGEEFCMPQSFFSSGSRAGLRA